jgi:hypothetical protein
MNIEKIIDRFEDTPINTSKMGTISNCKICGKLIKRSGALMKVYPPDYDFGCCNECNQKAENQD